MHFSKIPVENSCKKCINIFLFLISKAEEKKLKAAQEISENFEVGILFWLQFNL